jgi:hypothetical protein
MGRSAAGRRPLIGSTNVGEIGSAPAVAAQVIPHMLAAGGGAIVQTSSVQGLQSMKGVCSAYYPIVTPVKRHRKSRND